MNLTITKEAYRDIDSIYDYTLANWSKSQADKYFKVIVNAIRKLTKFPDVGRDLKVDDLDYNYFSITSHLIFTKFKKTK
ncbi:type II toxin-antitoxin system RelE/ParE family toxin [Candidatus Kapabacteria bacterium]|nr:type II toxin-antitoxin system RelE/ParE family toxin [Candidatus Kapabacteria bacterium]